MKSFYSSGFAVLHNIFETEKVASLSFPWQSLKEEVKKEELASNPTSFCQFWLSRAPTHHEDTNKKCTTDYFLEWSGTRNGLENEPLQIGRKSRLMNTKFAMTSFHELEYELDLRTEFLEAKTFLEVY